MFWQKWKGKSAALPSSDLSEADEEPPLSAGQAAEAELQMLMPQLEALRRRMLDEIAEYSVLFYGRKARQVAVRFPEHTKSLGERLPGLKRDVQALQATAAQAVTEQMDRPALWWRMDVANSEWWWLSARDCDYRTSDADRELRDRLYRVFERVKVVLEHYGYEPYWRNVNSDSRLELFGQEGFRQTHEEYCTLLDQVRGLRLIAERARKNQARIEAERLWQEA